LWALADNHVMSPTTRNPSPVRHPEEVNGKEFSFYCVRWAQSKHSAAVAHFRFLPRQSGHIPQRPKWPCTTKPTGGRCWWWIHSSRWCFKLEQGYRPKN